MRTKEEIKAFIKSLKSKEIKILDKEGFLIHTDKTGHWEDCLDWVLQPEGS